MGGKKVSEYSRPLSIAGQLAENRIVAVELTGSVSWCRAAAIDSGQSDWILSTG